MSTVQQDSTDMASTLQCALLACVVLLNEMVGTRLYREMVDVGSI